MSCDLSHLLDQQDRVVRSQRGGSTDRLAWSTMVKLRTDRVSEFRGCAPVPPLYT
eukprot:gene19965-26675_t